jgi:hypothetical protein
LLPKVGSILSSFQIILEGVEPFSTKKKEKVTMTNMQMKSNWFWSPLQTLTAPRLLHRLGFHADFDQQVNENLRFVQLTPKAPPVRSPLGLGLQTCRQDRKRAANGG